MIFCFWLVFIFELVNSPKSIFVHSVTLQAGAHLDLNVAVMVQKAFTREGCRQGEEMGQIKIDCVQRKCAQTVQYKVDLGYSNVRPTAMNGRPLDHPGGYSAYLAGKNRLSLELAQKVARLNNDAFQPFLYAEFERLIADFYNGHSRILGLFNISMEKFINEEFSSENWTKNEISPCAELAIFNESKRNLVEMLERNWQINLTKHSSNTIRKLTFFEVIKLRIPPSPIQLIECYNIATQKQALINTNHLFRLLVHLSNGTRPFRSKLNENCQNVLNGVDQIVKNESLINRLLYNPMRSLFIRDLEAILSTKAARGQTGSYYRGNLASIRFRFMSMTSIVMQESREYNNFNLLVDLGSTLGLYFGLTILTLFELFIFVFYRAGARDPTEVQILPPQSHIYNIPPIGGNRTSVKKMATTTGKLRQRRTNAVIKEEMGEDYSAPIPLPF